MSEQHQLDPSILRQYDIRGIVGSTLSATDVRVIGRAFGSIAVRQGGKTAMVGYDGRLSSPQLEAAMVEGLCSTGLTVYRSGLGASPMLYYATHMLKADAGIMITGSHNPSDYNGVKMSLAGKSFFGTDIQDLGKLAAAGDFVTPENGAGEAINHPVKHDAVIKPLAGKLFNALNVFWRQIGAQSNYYFALAGFKYECVFGINLACHG